MWHIAIEAFRYLGRASIFRVAEEVLQADQQEASRISDCCLLLDSYFVALLFDLRDGGGTVLRNVGGLPPYSVPFGYRKIVQFLVTAVRPSYST
jgi:hypothetical protein